MYCTCITHHSLAQESTRLGDSVVPFEGLADNGLHEAFTVLHPFCRCKGVYEFRIRLVTIADEKRPCGYHLQIFERILKLPYIQCTVI